MPFFLIKKIYINIYLSHCESHVGSFSYTLYVNSVICCTSAAAALNNNKKKKNNRASVIMIITNFNLTLT